MINNFKKVVFENYANFEGRARRREYWMFALANCLIGIIWGVIMGILGLPQACVYLPTLALFLPGLAVSVRRLHDIGKSGWWLLIAFIPLIGGIWLLILHAQDGQPGSNQYGENPKENSDSVSTL